jgi:aminopeptidase N
MSAETVSKTPVAGNKNKYEFNMFNPVPSYLLAIVAGNVES